MEIIANEVDNLGIIIFFIRIMIYKSANNALTKIGRDYSLKFCLQNVISKKKGPRENFYVVEI